MFRTAVFAIALLTPISLGAQETATPPSEEKPATLSLAYTPTNSAVQLRFQEYEKYGNLEPLLTYLNEVQDPPSLAEDTRQKIEEALLSYSKPLPASNAKDNMRGYKALSKIAPENAVYQSKAESYAKAYDNQRFAILSKLKKKTNEFDGTSFYSHPNTPRYTDTRNYLEVYMGVQKETVFLRMWLNYTSDDWLFIENARANIDGDTVLIPASDWSRDNDSEIWEWADELVRPELRSILERIANSKKTIIRFDGSKFYDDWTVPAKDKKAILEMFAAEDAMKEKIASN